MVKSGDTSSDADRLAAEIVAVDCFPVALPMKKPLAMSSHVIRFGPSLFVRIRSRDGVEGWGEAGTDLTMSGDTLRGMAAAVEEHFKPRLIGTCALDRAGFAASVGHLIYGNGGVKAALDIALLDLVGKIRSVSAVEVLGGAVRRSVPVLRLIGGSGDPAKDISDAVALREEGYKAFKLKVGVLSVEQEAAIANQLREVLGNDVSLAADANMAWTVDAACRFADLATPARLSFIEQPVKAGDTHRMAAVAKASRTPIGADEAIHGMSDILGLFAANAVGSISLKSIKLGGVTPVVNAAAVCDALGLMVNVAMLVESGLASSAMLHVACAAKQVDGGLSLGHLLLTGDPTHHGIEIVDGEALCPAGPGLGVSVDPDDLRKFAPN